jgi:uncharacterized protein YkwD
MLRCLRLVSAVMIMGACVPAAGRGADPQEPAKLKLSADEQKILDLTNQARARENLPPVKPNARLFEAARAHSANMARQDKMEHDLDGKKPSDRVTATGYRWSRVAENIAATDGDPPAVIFKGWMESPKHRANILNKDFSEIGIGIARSDKGDVYYTQDFGKPKN